MDASYSNIQQLQLEYNNAINLNKQTMDITDYYDNIHSDIRINVVSNIITELLQNHQVLIKNNSRMLYNSNTNFTSANNICG